MGEHLYAVIMAGGGGTRLWPRSRQALPKPFLDLLGPRTLLQATVDRLAPLIPLQRIWVVTGREYAPVVQEQVPGLPAGNIICEPEGRDTAPCIGLAAMALRQRDPAAIMAVFPADHQVADGAEFRRAVAAAAQVARQGYLVTLGIRPTHPHTGYGYIRRGEALPPVEGVPAYRVRQFAEKPDAATARQFVASGEYFWNGGIFAWPVERILAEISHQLPWLGAALATLAPAWDTPDREWVLTTVWGQVRRMSIDYGVMEHAEQVAVVPLDAGWDDVGNWTTLAGLLAGDQAGNVAAGPGRSLLLDTHASYIYAAPGRLVIALGLEGMVVVDTPDALLICPKDRAQDTREVVAQLQARGLDAYL